MRKPSKTGILKNPLTKYKAVLELPSGEFTTVPILYWRTDAPGNPRPVVLVGPESGLCGYLDTTKYSGERNLLRLDGRAVEEFEELTEDTDPQFS